MPINARIKYVLSQQGRRDSLRQGGNGKRVQELDGLIEPEDLLDSFNVDEQGSAYFDATHAPVRTAPEKWKWTATRNTPTPGGVISNSYDIEWDVAPSWSELVDFARWAYNILEEQEEESLREAEEENRRYSQLAAAFLADPEARADKIMGNFVEIQGMTFYGAVAIEADKRAAEDFEETLTEWIRANGSENQRQRLTAGLLPWNEARVALSTHLFAPLGNFAPYARFKPEEVCKCLDFRTDDFSGPCDVKFQSVDATELTADEWEQFAAIKNVVPDADFQLREHRAKCKSLKDPVIRRGVIVKRTVDSLTFKREYALGGSHDAV